MKKILFLLCLSLLITGCSLTSHSVSGSGSFISQFNDNNSDNLVSVAENIYLDITNNDSGYFSVKINDEEKVYKIQLTYQDEKFYYDINSDGSICFYTFSYGEGEYKISIMKNTIENKYVSVYSTKVNVILNDEFQPFIRSNFNVKYANEGQVVRQAEMLTEKCDSDADFLEAVYKTVCDRLSYDNHKASTVEKGYIPDGEEIWNKKKGICYDYAVVAAIMLRSQGIPCKVVTGYVNDDVYHAWNVVYLENEGWIVFNYSLETNSWSRLDLTLSDQMITKDFLKFNYVDALCY